ncbi:hypothetical protein HBH98_048350 [Parastagonospora nodorum]|nr:hypothetical protein HBH49_045430 [Parastagonospora nodorum]KAH4197839.1 hypothetical protein HBH42_062630 [Parastagonospora nodorum]KAH4350385.1 hypothetical protein HBH98_048350 [Parastagonospora nodorum]KAH4380238.1 hypothetical protein HBH97_093510 [Parastagonospora nodorum]KAH4424960.1 hypothetical protein HBH99_035940 [Parastagonospora nodorum]
MASPHAPGLDEHHHHAHHFFLAPPNVTTVSFTHTLSHPADAGYPPSLTALAAATTLATLADGRPPASYEDYEDDDDDDHSGGISITPADLHEYTAASAMADTHMTDTHMTDTHMTEQDVAEQQQSLMAESPFEPATESELPLPPVPSYHIPSIQAPFPQPSSGYTSSSDSIQEPLTPIVEDHFSIEDGAAFVPIASFFHRIAPAKPAVPGLDLLERPPSITRDQLQGDSVDPQGIDWFIRNITRSHVRAKRAAYQSAQLSPSPHQTPKATRISNSDNFFQFRRYNAIPEKERATSPHFQLRNVLTATSWNDIYYTCENQVIRTDAEGTVREKIIDFSNRLSAQASITTIASIGNVLIAGTFDGEYAIADLSSAHDSSCTFGRTSDLNLETRSRIVNHMHLCESRSTYTPQAVLCSNDYHMRVLDCATNQFTHSYLYPAAVNCSATSPNGRMRVVVGDFKETLITNAETGQPFEILHGHNEDAFACAWADDGIHVATAAQDSSITVWDARNWATPIKNIASQLSIPRSLRFSPVGSGPRVLVAAEADDYINVINAQTFESKQVFDFFGPIAGISFTPDGQSLFIANGEKKFGGIIELDRTGWAERTAQYKNFQDPDWDDLMTDWAYDDGFSSHDRAVCGDTERERRCVDFGGLVV